MIYDPYSRQIQEDPFPAYRYFLEEEPVTYNEKMDFYAVFRFEDVWNATLDWKTYSSRLGPSLENRGEMPGEVMSIIGMDPPRHVRIRTIVSKGFTPRRIAALEAEVREIAARYLDEFVEKGGGEIQHTFSNKLPMDVISALLGLPEENRDEFREGVDMMLSRDPETGLPPADAIEAVGRNRKTMLDLLAARRRDPKEDLISVMAHAEYEDVDGEQRKLDDNEVCAFINLLAAAGYETTMKLIGNCIVYLWQHPDQRAELWADPSLMGGAIEEVLRYDAPSQFQGRVANAETTLHGTTIPKDARVALVTGSAGRDPREFDEPDRFDIHR
ncbi:MAG: cytochrome P450, partial [Myxococcota bacterium]